MRNFLLITIILTVLGVTSAFSQQIVRDPRYPAHWWTPIVDPKKPDWEILPQEAAAGEVILSKRHELGLLSNFAATPFVFHGKKYASLEGFWQMMKYPEDRNDPRAKFAGLEWKYTRDQVAQMVAFEANAAGALASANMTKMGITWVSFEGRRFEYKPAAPGEHYKLIVAATWEKVKQNPEVKRVLLATGDLILKPDHHQEANAPAAWAYYEILTQIRTELQKGEPPAQSLPLLTFDDLKAGKPVRGPFRIAAYVLDIYKCPPCPPPNQCKPCIPDNIVVTDELDAKDLSQIKRLRIYTGKTDQFEAKKKYMFTVKIKGNAPSGRPIESVELIGFEAVKH
ncbi:MAG TPA: hypothetical protein VNF70_03560 [Pyrinomonadaceae bacterium]|nr:hypothetical protein [Pyrinomonadaceae bacterium]